MSYMNMSGSLTGSRLATKEDFCASSQIAAMRPVLNSTAGPALFLVADYPFPKYKTCYPVAVNHGETKTVTITFLSKDANGFVAKLAPVGGVTGFCDAILERLDLEVWAAKLHVTGSLAPGANQQDGNAILTLTNAGVTTEVAVEFNVTRVPPQPPVVVPLSVSQGPQGYTPIHRSLVGSGYMPPNRSQLLGSAYTPPVPVATALPSSVIYNSRYNDLQASLPPPPPIYTPGRHHSDYVYDSTKPVPQYYQDEIRQSILETSMRGSQLSRSSFPPAGRAPTELAFSQPAAAQMSTAATLAPIPAAPVQSAPVAAPAQPAPAPAAAQSGDLKPKELEPEQAEEQVVEADPEGDRAAAPSAIQVLPQSVLFRPCEPGQYQLAQLRLKNTSGAALTAKLQLAHRSFATSTANCKYGQLSPDISCFSFEVDGQSADKTELALQPGEAATLTLKFAPKSAEYALNCAKIVIFVAQGESYQVVLLGVNGEPRLTALEKSLADVSRLEAHGQTQLRVRNDGYAPAFVGLEGQVEPQLTIIDPQGSEEVALHGGNSLRIKYGNDYLRLLHEGCLKRGPWAEMVADLLVDAEEAERLLEDCTESVLVELE